MKEQFLEQFGIAVQNLNQVDLTLLNDLNLDLIQVPLHISKPPAELVDQVLDIDTNIVGKYVPGKQYNSLDKDFYTDLFKAYKGRIRIWDFFGEPESRPDIHQGARWYGTAKALVEMMKMIYSIGKSIDPKNQIGAGGFISTTFHGYFGNEDRSNFLDELFNEGILDYMDFCSTNTYAYGYGGRKSVVAGLIKIKGMLAEYDSSMPITVSEFGAPCSGNPMFLHIIQTERRQAVQLIENTMLHQSLGVDYSIWFCWKWQGWGIINPETMQPRESYLAYKTMIRMLKGAKFVGVVKAYPGPDMSQRYLTDKTEWYKFNHGNKDIHVIFITGGANLIRSIPDDVRVYNMFGYSIPENKVGFNGEPKYVICDKDSLHNLNFFLE